MKPYTGQATTAAVNPDRQVPALIGGRRRKRRRPSMAKAVLAAASKGGRR